MIGGILLAVAGALVPAVPAAVAPAVDVTAEWPAAEGVATQSQATGDDLRLFLITFGPGEAVWERFGHNALWIQDPVAGTDVAYHYGLFDMSEAGFLVEFLQGRMAYSMGSADAFLLMDAYRRVGRSATVQELALSQATIRRLQEFLTWNLRPENRVYRYDYFRDNCSTRVRDALDLVLDGALAERLGADPTGVTYRAEALALTAEDRLLTAGMDLGLGPLADRRLTQWDLAFIPMRLRDAVRDIALESGGRNVPLVIDERRLPALGAPDEVLAVVGGAGAVRTLAMLAVGVLVGGLFAGLGRLAGGRRPVSAPSPGRGRAAARWALGIGGALWGLLAGVLGLILLGLWMLTDHEFAHANENLLQTNPLALLLVVLIPLAVARRGSRSASVTAAALAALSVLGLIIHPLPVTPQSNLAIIALALPVHLGILSATTTLNRQAPSP